MSEFRSPFTSSYAVPSERQDQPMSYAERKRFAEGWSARRVEEKPSRNVIITERDKRAGFERVRDMRKREQQGIMNDIPLLAERLFVEAADIDGGISGNGARWFGDTTVTYFCNLYDDALRGGDALLFVIDEDDERVAYPLAIDITTSASEVDRKIDRDITMLLNAGPRSVYWYDTSSDDPRAVSFDKPGEGSILATHATVLIPEKIVRAFFNPTESASKAKNLMEGLGPSIMIQIQQQLEMQAALLTGELTLESFQEGLFYYKSVQDRPDLRLRIQEVIADKKAPITDYQRKLLVLTQKSLETIWKRRDHFDRQGRASLLLRDSIPPILKEFQHLPAHYRT